MKRYYSLIVKEVGSPWSVQFGDFDKEVVEQELEDEKHNWPRGTRFRVIKTGAKQEEINSAIRDLNQREKAIQEMIDEADGEPSHF